jgi:YidC/Oxa1 family membrane protein insertase
MMEVYREAGMNPLASIILIFLQIPIIIALYYAVYSGGGVALPAINLDVLYAFISAPDSTNVSMDFLGLVDITERSLLLALGAGITQYVFVKMSMPVLPPKVAGSAPDFKEDFMRNMQMQMRYVMPVIIVLVAYSISAAIALYFLVSNVISIAQEQYIKKHR